MSRFDIIVDRHPDKPTAYSFKKTNRVGLVYEYIKKCIEDDVALEASNLYPSVLDQALLKHQENYRIPIITKSEKTLRVLSMSSQIKRIYTVDSIPKDVIRVICYWDLNPKEIPVQIEVALTIIRNADD
jgi:hypothetical protein